ncbi:MAG: endonuclease/exonuclease/phosphatase family protein [Candidatus Thiodiazotropha sp.]
MKIIPFRQIRSQGAMGGVALLFRKNLDFRIKKLAHGENRMVVIEVQSVPPLCICNIYMPSRNSKGNGKGDDNYQSCLDQLEEVLNIYNDSHAVVILGDFNASLMGRKGNEQDQQLKAFVANNSLGHLQTGIPTFFHPNKTDSAEIDYVLFNRLGGGAHRLCASGDKYSIKYIRPRSSVGSAEAGAQAC